MARIRSVHPSLFTDEAWVSCSPLARILYIGLWTDADDQGLFEWKPLQLRMRLLPGDSADVAALLAELTSAGLIAAFEIAGRSFGAIKSFRKFQRPQKPNAIHPTTAAVKAYVGLSGNDTGPVEERSRTSPVIPPQMEDVGGRVEEESTTSLTGGGPPSKSPSGHRLPVDWKPNPDNPAYLAKLGLTAADGEVELEKFSDYWRRVPGAKGRSLDWNLNWKGWLRRAADDRKRNSRNGHERPDHSTAKLSAHQANLARAVAGAALAADDWRRDVGDP